MFTLIILSIMIGFSFNFQIFCFQELVPEGSAENNPCVYKVEEAFDHIPGKTDQFFSAWTDSVIDTPKYQQIQSNKYKGIWGGSNHFQAIKRLPAYLKLSNYFAITGSDPITPRSQLFIMRIDSSKNDLSLHKNSKHATINQHDNLIRAITLDESYWHAGGIDSVGKYLALAIDNETDSRILFYDILKPAQPKRLDVIIERPSRNAIAVGITRLQNGQFVVAVWTDGYKNSSRGLDFYFSRTTKLLDGFEDHHTIHVPDKSFENFMHQQNYQNISFINDYEGKIYLVGTGNTSATAPLKIGIDHADLFLVEFKQVTPQMMERAMTYEPSGLVAKLSVGSLIPKVTFIKEKHMFCKQGICNFNAGANIYIPDQQHLFLYSLPHWLAKNGTQLNFAQYASIQKTYPD